MEFVPYQLVQDFFHQQYDMVFPACIGLCSRVRGAQDLFQSGETQHHYLPGDSK